MRKILNIIKISLKNHTFYFYDILGGYIGMSIRVLIILFLYKAIYAGIYDNQIFGISINEASWAVIFAQIVVFSKRGITNEISDDIKSGKVSIFLLNPVSYIWFKFLQNFTGVLYNSISFLIIGLIIGYLMLSGIQTSFFGIIGGLVLFLGALFIAFFGYFAVGLIAFISEDVDGFSFLYSKFDMLFGGNILPIAFMPVLMQKIAFLLPFVYSGYTAGLIFANFSFNLFMFYLFMQIMWIIILISICNLIFSYGKNKLTINGG